MNDAVENLTFSEEALSNRTLFLSTFNDINVFVEDVGKEYIYEEIFERLFDGEINIFTVFPLGGKDAVIKKQKESNLYDSNGKLNVFLVDGDFDILWEDQQVIAPNLIYLTRYNIESYYCSKEAILKYMRGFLKCTRNEVEAKIHFEEWSNFFKEEAGRLFVLFAIVKRYKIDLPNVSTATGKFLDANGHLVSDRFEDYNRNVIEKIGPVEPYIGEIEEKINEKIVGDKSEKILSIICGKYKMESLCRHLKKCCHKNIDRETFRSVLISSFDLEPLLFLKNAIIHLVSNTGPEEQRI